MNALGTSIFHKLLGWFVGVGVLLVLLFGSVQFVGIKRQVEQDMTQSARHALVDAAAYFDKGHALPLESSLHILEKLSGLDEMLQSWGEASLLIKPDVEKQFLHILTAQKGWLLSIRYFDRQGEERVAVADQKRMRDYRQLSSSGDEDPFYRQAGTLHRQLRNSPPDRVRYLGPFRMSDGRWTILAGIAKSDPSIGGFAGSILLHCDLSEYLSKIKEIKISGHHGVQLYHRWGAQLISLEDGPALPMEQLAERVVVDLKMGDADSGIAFKLTFRITPEMVHEAIQKELQPVLLPIVLILLLVTGFAYLVSRKLAEPIIQLRRGMAAIGQGRFDTTVAVTTRDEIGELATAFNGMVRDLQVMTCDLERARFEADAANRAKSLFLANMSHEIRTPMNAVIGLTDLALQAELLPKSRDHLSKIADASHSLLRIINDILDFSKIDAGRMELEKVDFPMREPLRHLADLFRVQVAQKGIELIFSCSEACRAAFHGDPLRLEQILMNLIGNAVKFTPPGGEIEVRVRRETSGGAAIRLHFSVRDNGIGIPAELAARLFQPFSQADLSTTRIHGGTGLGLAISKRLAELMGGSLWLESEPDHGSTFHFMADFQPAQSDAWPDLGLPKALRHLPVLLISGRAASREAVNGMLDHFGFEVVAVSSLQEAERQVALICELGDHPFRLVVVDETGLNAASLERLRQAAGQTTWRVLELRAPRFAQEPMIEPPGVHLLEKPIHCTALFEAILACFGLRREGEHRAGGARIDLAAYRTHLEGRRVLLVEDHPVNRQVAQENLESVGLVVEWAENGLEAVHKVKTGRHDLVLMDIQMPQMDGYEATRVIRADARFRDLPILAMTAHALEDDRRASLEAGMNGHVSKPIDRRRLFDTLMRWMVPGHVSASGSPAAECIRMPNGGAEIVSGVDHEALLERINHKYSLLQAVLSDFLRNHTSIVATLRRLLFEQPSPDHLEKARHSVHSLKGASGNLAAMALFEAVRALETAIRTEERREEWSWRLDRVEVELMAVLSDITHWLREIEPEEPVNPLVSPMGAPDTMDRSQLALWMRDLDRMLERQDFSSQFSVERLGHLLSGVETVDSLIEAMNRLDFPEARRRLRELAARLSVRLEEG
ncbi:MAG: response regulator [Magnetococcales bacterium]|nr:response regulator [Magnetococcales bacterium]